MLETIREFALERLEESGELAEMRRRHIDFFLEFARQDAEAGQQSSEWLERLDSEHDNFRAALQYSARSSTPALELSLVAVTCAVLGTPKPLARRPRAHPRSARSSSRRTRRAANSTYEPRVDHGRSSRATCRQLGRLRRARRSCMKQRGEEDGVGDALHLLGVVAAAEGSYEEARALLEQGKSIRERVGTATGVQASFHNLGLLAMDQGDFTLARAELGSALAIAEREGLEWQVANSRCDLAFAELGEGRIDEARERFERGQYRCVTNGVEGEHRVLPRRARCSVLRRGRPRSGAHVSSVRQNASQQEIPLRFEPYAEQGAAQARGGASHWNRRRPARCSARRGPFALDRTGRCRSTRALD